MKEGWICPKCGRVIAPFILECHDCNQLGYGIGNSEHVIDFSWPCPRCGIIHGSEGCPEYTVPQTTGG